MLLKRVRHYFNMIEITLAIAIMGVGITSLMVLLPVGLRNSQESISNNYVPIIADYFYGLIRTDLIFRRTTEKIKLPGVSSGEDESGSSGSDGVSYYEYESLTSSVIDDFEEKSKLDELLSGSGSDANTILSIDEDGEIENFTWMFDWITAGSDNELEIDTDGDNKLSGVKNQPVNIFYHDTDTSDYVVVFRSKSETGDGLIYDMVDFAAEVKLFKDDALNINGVSKSSDDLMRVYMHISWPIELPLSKRQSRVYVWDVARGVFE